MSRAASPPASAAALRALRAALENASRFLSFAPWWVRIPLRGAQTKTVPFRGPFPILWWAMRDVRVRLAPPAFASGLRPSRAALENASRFLSFAPWRVRIPLQGAQKERLPLLTALSFIWWAMRDVACGFAARFRFVASLLACFAGKRFAFPQLRTLTGSNPMHGALNKKGPHCWRPIKSNGGR